MNETFFSDYLNRLENLSSELRKEVEELPAEAMDWTPGPEMNSAAVLLAHTAGSMRFWIGDAALGEPSGRVREQEFETHSLSGAEMLARIDAAVEYARGALPRLRLEQLGEMVELEDRRVTRGWALLHALDHAYTHLGHIQLTCQLLRQARM